MPTTPYALGYRMPAEWERHEGTWLAWPKNPDTFPADQIGPVRQAYLTMIQALSPGERVHLLVDDEATDNAVLSSLPSVQNLAIHKVRSSDVWVRDYGPIFVKSGGLLATKWLFNAWGNKYEDLTQDNETGTAIAQQSGFPVFETGRVLEGGSVDVDGRGTLLTTRQCLLNKNRNPGLNGVQIEQLLRDYLGATTVVWLESGIEGDDTDGHVDDIARFVSEDTVVCAFESDRGDENYDRLSANLELLKKAKASGDRRLKVVPIEMPHRIDGENGRLPASYANFYIGNAAVLVPTFEDPNDRKALATLEKLFPERRVVGIDCRALVRGLGTIHCVTQQQPAAP